LSWNLKGGHFQISMTLSKPFEISVYVISKESLNFIETHTVLLKWRCRMHFENLGTTWMLGRSQNLISDSNKLLRIFNEFQCILFVLLLKAPISFNLWQQDIVLGADRCTIGLCTICTTKNKRRYTTWHYLGTTMNKRR
jgi:hypothetical protein